jgi:hypothetical protein
MGTRVREITDSSAVVWVRTTLNSYRNSADLVILGRVQDFKKLINKKNYGKVLFYIGISRICKRINQKEQPLQQFRP